MRPPMHILDRLADKFTVGDGCWEWTAALDRKGYGRFGGETTSLAHRVVYEVMVGPIPAGYTLDHLCRNKKCVRPDHLEPTTALENHRRWASAITHCKYGHPFDEQNTWIRPNGKHRACKKCNARSQREWQQRQRRDRAIQ